MCPFCCTKGRPRAEATAGAVSENAKEEDAGERGGQTEGEEKGQVEIDDMESDDDVYRDEHLGDGKSSSATAAVAVAGGKGETASVAVEEGRRDGDYVMEDDV